MLRDEYKIDFDLEQLLQECCKTFKISAYFTDEALKIQSELLGNDEIVQAFEMNRDEVLEDELLSRIHGNSIEDQVVDVLTGTNIYVGALAIVASKHSKKYFVIYAHLLSEEEFYCILDMLRVLLGQLFQMQMVCQRSQDELREKEYSTKQMTDNYSKNMAMTEIVQLLDSEEAIDVILQRSLDCIGNYLKTEAVYIFQLDAIKPKMDVLAQWNRLHPEMMYDKKKEVDTVPILYTDKPHVISSDAILTPELKKLTKGKAEIQEMKAAIIYPLLYNDKKRMCACIVQKEEERIWSSEETLFVAEVMKILHSILTRRIQENSIISSYTSLKAILDNMICAICVMDKKEDKEQVLFLNRKFKETFGEQIDKAELRSITQQAKEESEITSCEIRIDNQGHWYDLYHREISWVDGRKAVLYSLYEITDKKIYQKKIEQQAYTDFLTGLYNRMCCERDLAKHIDYATQQNQEGALIYMDLDDFKHINDGIGHQYGDVLLKEIANDLKRVKGIESSCYRVGGDEFIIIIPPHHYEQRKTILSQIQEIFKKPRFLKNSDYYCTSSTGIVEFPKNGQDVQSLIKKADITMYEAKKSGKNKVAFFSDHMGEHTNKRLDVEKNMRQATAAGNHEFLVYYQPLINVATKQCIGAEALLRWQSSELGFVMPAEFIPVAEYLGLIHPIGTHILKQACMKCKEWNDLGFEHHKVGVNLSVVQLLQNDIVEIIQEAIQITGINPKNLTLEVTESLAINDMERMKQIISGIKALGVKIALDDFGTGYSSLNHMKEIACDILKVDRIFIKDLKDDAYSQSFVKVVKELSNTLGVTLCVEGVETKEQYHILKEMGVDLIQGYYFDRPMSADEYEKKYINPVIEK